jgi:molybdate transport system ATP-binding protein
MPHTTLPPLVELRRALVARQGRVVLDIERWSLEQGAHWAVLGPNGAGKSTFFALLRGELWPLQRPGPPPRLYNLGASGESHLPLRSRMGAVSSELQQLYQRRSWRISVFDTVCSGFFDAPLLYRTPDAAQRRRAQELLELVQLADMRRRLLPGLSQGELRRVLVARALAPLSEIPAVLLLDEVCDGLDPSSRDAVMQAVERIIQHGGVQVLASSHRPQELPSGLTHAVVFEQGRILRQGPLDETLRQEPAVAALHDPEVLPFRERPASRFGDDPVLHLENVSILRDGAPILTDITWTARPGEHWGVLGHNGAGKSTLLRCLAGELHPSCVQGPAGRVLRFGSPDIPPGGLRDRIGLISPELQAGYGYDVSAEELVWTGFDASIGLHGRAPTAEERREARKWLELAGMREMAQRPVAALSSGQARRCFLARALAANQGRGPELLLLDEPCSGLDADARRSFLALLSRVARAGVPLVCVTHHQDELPPEISHVLLLRKGRIQAQGKRDDVLGAPS